MGLIERFLKPKKQEVPPALSPIADDTRDADRKFRATGAGISNRGDGSFTASKERLDREDIGRAVPDTEDQSDETSFEMGEAEESDNSEGAIGLEFGAERLPPKATEVLAALDNHPTVTEAQVPPERRKLWQRLTKGISNIGSSIADRVSKTWNSIPEGDRLMPGIAALLVATIITSVVMIERSNHIEQPENLGGNQPEKVNLETPPPAPNFQGVVDAARTAATSAPEQAITPEAGTVHIAGDAKGAIHSIKTELREKGYQASDMELGQIATRIAKAAMGENWNNLTPQGWNGNLNEITSALSDPADIAAVNLLVEKPEPTPTTGTTTPVAEVAQGSTSISWLPDAPASAPGAAERASSAGISDTDSDIYFPSKPQEQIPTFNTNDWEKPFIFDQTVAPPAPAKKVVVRGKDTPEMVAAATERRVNEDPLNFAVNAAGFSDPKYLPADKEAVRAILLAHQAEFAGRNTIQDVRSVTNNLPELREITQRPLQRAEASIIAALDGFQIPFVDVLSRFDEETRSYLPNMDATDLMAAAAIISYEAPMPDGNYPPERITQVLKFLLTKSQDASNTRSAVRAFGNRYDEVSRNLQTKLDTAMQHDENQRLAAIRSGHNYEPLVKKPESKQEVATANPWISQEPPTNPMWSTEEQAPTNASANLNIPADPNNLWSIDEPPKSGGPTQSATSSRASQR